MSPIPVRPAESPAEPDPIVRAKSLVLNGAYDAAVLMLRAHLAESPEHAVAWRRLAGALIGADAYDEAISAATRASELAPHDAVAHRYRGLAHLYRGELTLALAAVSTAIDLDPDDAESNALLAETLIAMGTDHPRAAAAAAKAVAINPDGRAVRRVNAQLRVVRRAAAAVLLLPVTLSLAVVLLAGWALIDVGTSTIGAQVMLGTGVAAALGLLGLTVVRRRAANIPVPPPSGMAKATAAITASLLSAAIAAVVGGSAASAFAFGGVTAVFGLGYGWLPSVSLRQSVLRRQASQDG